MIIIEKLDIEVISVFLEVYRFDFYEHPLFQHPPDSEELPFEGLPVGWIDLELFQTVQQKKLVCTCVIG